MSLFFFSLFRVFSALASAATLLIYSNWHDFDQHFTVFIKLSDNGEQGSIFLLFALKQERGSKSSNPSYPRQVKWFLCMGFECRNKRLCFYLMEFWFSIVSVWHCFILAKELRYVLMMQMLKEVYFLRGFLKIIRWRSCGREDLLDWFL